MLVIIKYSLSGFADFFLLNFGRNIWDSTSYCYKIQTEIILNKYLLCSHVYEYNSSRFLKINRK